MCGRYTSVTPVAALVRYFSVDEVVAEQLAPRYNVAPTQEVYAIARHGDTMRLGTLRWGLIPPWAEDLRIGARMINARAESVADRPAFRDAFARRRCLIPADGFYEWSDVAGGSLRQPWYIRPRSGHPLAFAGLWESWRPATAHGEGLPRIVSTTIVTTTANEAITDLHHRMPVVLAPDTWDAWLDPTNHDVDALQGLLAPAPPADFEVTAVRPLVNNVANEGPDLLDPVVPTPARERA